MDSSNEMNLVFSKDFQKEFKKIKDQSTAKKLVKQLRKLHLNPVAGKPLRNELKSLRSIRLPPYRIIYKLTENEILILSFDHRKKVYRNLLH